MSDGVSPYDTTKFWRSAKKAEAETCLRCIVPGGCDDGNPDCPLPRTNRQPKRKFRSAIVADIARADGGRLAAARRRKPNG